MARQHVGSTSGTSLGPPPAAFDNATFIGPDQQESYKMLLRRKVWPARLFNIPHAGNYHYFVEDMENKG